MNPAAQSHMAEAVLTIPLSTFSSMYITYIPLFMDGFVLQFHVAERITVGVDL